MRAAEDRAHRLSLLAAATCAQYTGWGDTQLKIHLHRLEELEYLLVHRGGRGQSFVYELVFARQGDSGKPVLPGLIEVEKLRKHATTKRSRGQKAERSGSSRPQVGGMSGAVQAAESPVSMRRPMAILASRSKKALLRGTRQNGHRTS